MNQYNVKIVDVNGTTHGELVESGKDVDELLREYQSTVNTLPYVSVNGKSIKTDKVVSIQVY